VVDRVSADAGGGQIVQLVNLTPHPINIAIGDAMIDLPASDRPARLAGAAEDGGTLRVEGLAVPLVVHRYSRVDGLPAEQDGVRYIVSQLVLDFADDRGDLVTPTDLIRDTYGNVIGCRALARRAH
jgi:hypothetical protein